MQITAQNAQAVSCPTSIWCDSTINNMVSAQCTATIIHRTFLKFFAIFSAKLYKKKYRDAPKDAVLVIHIFIDALWLS
jgi:hypothetical protein